MRELELRSVANDDELARANELMAKAHYRTFFDALHWLETCGVGYPGFQREHTRIALWHGELAGALRVTTHTIRIGEARLKTGGLGWITTESRHRHRGVARELMCDTLNYLKGQQYHLSMLFGIPNFYHRFGFVSSLAEYAALVPVTEEVMVPHAPYRTRPGKPGDIQAIQKIHYADDAEVACSHVRSSAHITNKWEHWKSVRVLTDEVGKVLAYFLPHRLEDEILVEESGVSDRSWCGAVTHAAAAMAMEECVSKIRFAGPPTHPLIQYLHQYKSTHEMRIHRDEGGMMAFVNLGEALESMIPEWESRLLRSAVRDVRTEFTLLIERKPYRVRANRGAVDIDGTNGKNKVSLTPQELIHLLTGYGFLPEILELKRRMLTPPARAFLEAVFPTRTPYVWAVDRF